MGWFGGDWQSINPKPRTRHSRDEWEMMQSPMYQMMHKNFSGQFGQQRSPTTVSPINPSGNNTFNYPTSQELWDTTYNLQPFQEQRGILGQMATPGAFQQSVNPYMTSLLQSLRGKGMESSSFADRNVANSLGSLWQNYQTNMLSGWQNMMSQMPGAMGMWQQPYSTVLGML